MGGKQSAEKKQRLCSDTSSTSSISSSSNSKHCPKLETKLRQVVLGVAAPYWKEEWKLLVAELADRLKLYEEVVVDKLDTIAGPNGSITRIFHLHFARAPSLFIHSYSRRRKVSSVNWSTCDKNEYRWMLITWDRTPIEGNYSAGRNDPVKKYHNVCIVKEEWRPDLYCHQNEMRKLLKMESLPFNLFITIFYEVGKMFGHDDPFTIERRRFVGGCKPGSLRKKEVDNVAEENFIYLLPQHYHPAFFSSVSASAQQPVCEVLCPLPLQVGQWHPMECENAWSLHGKLNLPELYAAPVTGGTRRKWKASAIFRDLVAPVQVGQLLKLIFHYSIQKQKLAEQLVKQLKVKIYEYGIPDGSDGIYLYLFDSDGNRRIISVDWLPTNHGDNSDDDKLIPYCFLEEGKSKSSTLSDDDQSDLSIDLNWNLHFEHWELGLLFAWIRSCYFSNGSQLENYFADLSPDDSFNDPNNLGGRFVDTPILHAMSSFRKILAAVTTLPLTCEAKTPMPVVLLYLVSSYLPFPLPNYFF